MYVKIKLQTFIVSLFDIAVQMLDSPCVQTITRAAGEVPRLGGSPANPTVWTLEKSFPLARAPVDGFRGKIWRGERPWIVIDSAKLF